MSWAARDLQLPAAATPPPTLKKTLLTTLLPWAVAWRAAHCFPIPLPSPVPANETPFANPQPGQYAVLKNINTKYPTDDHKACAIRLSQKFDKSTPSQRPCESGDSRS